MIHITLQAANITHVLDDCESKIEAACSYETNSTVMEVLDDCGTDWGILQNKSKECEEAELADCQCWGVVEQLKQEFQTKMEKIIF